MKKFVRIIEGNPVLITVRDLNKDPMVSFPENLNPVALAEHDIYPLKLTDSPIPALGQMVVEDTPTLIEGEWVQQWSIQPAPVPERVDMAQARLALLSQGITASMVDAQIAAMPSPQKEAAQIEWEYRTTVRRNSDLVISLGAALSLSEQDIDNLFYLAITL